MYRFRTTLVVALLVVVLRVPGVAAQSGSAGFAADIDAFWAASFAASGAPYSSPGVVPIESDLATECGVFSPWIIAGYCPLDGTIYYSAPIAQEILAAGDPFALVTIVAHEWGHHVQWLAGAFYQPSYQLEQQADCLAGAYTQDAAARGVIDTSSIIQAVSVSAQSGDATWLPQDAPGAHGSGNDRAQAFIGGYTGGIGNCGLPL